MTDGSHLIQSETIIAVRLNFPVISMNQIALTRTPSLFSLLAGLALPWSAIAVDFKEEIRPILNKKCFVCHGIPRSKGNLRMDRATEFSKRIGGDDPVIVPGDPSKSPLHIKAGLGRTDGEAMPPPQARERGAEPLTQMELDLVGKWIALGAKLEPGESGAPSSTTTEPEAPTADAPAAMKTELQTWSNTGGGSLQAAFVALSGTTVTLRKEDGTEFPYELANLSPESQALAQKLAAGE